MSKSQTQKQEIYQRAIRRVKSRAKTPANRMFQQALRERLRRTS